MHSHTEMRLHPLVKKNLLLQLLKEHTCESV